MEGVGNDAGNGGDGFGRNAAMGDEPDAAGPEGDGTHAGLGHGSDPVRDGPSRQAGIDEKDIGFDRKGIDWQAARGKRLGKGTGCGMIVSEARDHGIEGDKARSGERACRPHAAAQPLPPDQRLFDDSARTGKDGARGG